MLRDIVDDLTGILGSKEAASDWIFHNKPFKQVAGYDPFDYLAPGEFEALALLHSLVRMSAMQRKSLEGLRDNSFNPIDAALQPPHAYAQDPRDSERLQYATS
jgi:hypothetical protein